MKKLMMTAALLALPALAFAAPGNGVDLTWNDCVGGTAGTAATNKNFVCTGVQNQNYLLFVQFKVNNDFTAAAAWTMSADYINETGDLGANPGTGFWRLEAPCSGNNGKGLAVSSTPSASCSDAGILDCSDGGLSGSAVFAWFSNSDQHNNPQPGRARLIGIFSRADGIFLAAFQNYYLMHFLFNNRNRNACSDGCSDGGAIVLNDLKIESFDRPEYHVDGTDKLGECATLTVGAQGPGLCEATPVQKTTWGKLKAMYR
jgi:hypothetical protein